MKQLQFDTPVIGLVCLSIAVGYITDSLAYGWATLGAGLIVLWALSVIMHSKS